MYPIIPYEEKYKDDIIFCFLCAKEAIDGTPKLKDDLLRAYP